MSLKRWLLVSTLLIAAILAGCGTSNPPTQYGWCYFYNFATSDYGASLPAGQWQTIGGVRGFTTDETGNLSFGIVHDHTVKPILVVITVARASGVTGDIAISANGIIFGVAPPGGSFTATLPDAIVSHDVNVSPTSSTDEGSAINISLHADNTVQIRGIKVYGNDANPFDVDNCDPLTGTNTPTPEIPVSPLPSETPTLVTPSATPSNTGTITPTPTFTPTSCTATLDFTVSDYDASSHDSSSGTAAGSWSGGTGFVSAQWGGSTTHWGTYRWITLSRPMYITSWSATVSSLPANAGWILDAFYPGLGSGIGGTNYDLLWSSGLVALPPLTTVGDTVGSPENSQLVTTVRILIDSGNNQVFTWQNVILYGVCDYVTATPTASASPTPSRTNTMTPMRTNTPAPTATRTPVTVASPPPPTNTSVPSNTLAPSSTSVPTASRTPIPAPTFVTSPTPDLTATPTGGSGSDDNHGGDILNTIGDFFNWVVNTALNFFDWLGSVFAWINGTLGNIGTLIGNVWQLISSFLALLLALINSIIAIIGLVIAIIAHLLSLIAGWISQLIARAHMIINAWFTATPTAIPFLPQCISDPMGSDVCAFYYVLQNTVLAGGIGGLLIPLITLLLDLSMVFYFIRTVRNLIRKSEEVSE